MTPIQHIIPILGLLFPPILHSVFAKELQPRYELSLDANEFSVMVNAARNGVQKYGGGSEFKVLMLNNQGELVWKVTINNTRLMTVWTTWMTLFSDQLIKSVDTNKLDEVQLLSLNVAKSVKEKMEHATAHPIWQHKRLAGRLSKKAKEFFLQTEEGLIKLKGAKTEGLSPYAGSYLVVSGYEKAELEIEVTDFMQRQFNVLEMFVMSYCPYAMNAEEAIIKFLDENKQAGLNPKLDIRYIFYLVQKGDETSYTSMQGIDEVKESVVQMIIRDQYPKFFHPYLLRRASSEEKWSDLAFKIGMLGSHIEAINDRLKTDTRTLIEQEYKYVTEHYQIFDGSPQYAWEGIKLNSIKELELFKDLKTIKDASCKSK